MNKKVTMRTQRRDGLPLTVFVLKHSTQDGKITQKVKGSAANSHNLYSIPRIRRKEKRRINFRKLFSGLNTPVIDT